MSIVVGNIKMLSELSNFDESYGILRDRKYIEKMFKTLPYDERLTSAKEHCFEYIENRLQNRSHEKRDLAEIPNI